MSGPFTSGALLTIRFAFPNPTVTKNWRPIGRPNKLSWEEMKERDRIRNLAFVARTRGGWPASFYLPRRVRITMQAFGGLWDANAFDAMAKDALERVLYLNDKIVSTGEQHPAYDDGNGRRLVITAELMDVWSLESAAAIQRQDEARQKRWAATKDKRRLGRLREEMTLAEGAARHKISMKQAEDLRYGIEFTTR
jgi:hypothetical protein